MNIQTTLNDLTIKEIRENFISLMQYTIKKGNKAKIEKMFRSLLFFIVKNPNIQNNFKFEDILIACKETMPKISVKTKRKGSKNIYVPCTITASRSKYLSSSWILFHAKNKSNNKFYKNLAEELNESSKKKSQSFRKCHEVHKLAEISINNLKEKLK